MAAQEELQNNQEVAVIRGSSHLKSEELNSKRRRKVGEKIEIATQTIRELKMKIAKLDKQRKLPENLEAKRQENVEVITSRGGEGAVGQEDEHSRPGLRETGICPRLPRSQSTETS